MIFSPAPLLLVLFGLLLSSHLLCSMIPAVWYFLHLMSYYMKTSREAKVSLMDPVNPTQPSSSRPR